MKRFLYLLVWFPALLCAQSQDPCYSINDYNTQLKELNPKAIVDLPEGWSIFGYSCADSISAIDAFELIADKIEIVKDEWGLSYLPDWDFNALGSLKFSEGYQIKLNEEVTDFSFCEGVVLPSLEGCSDCEALNFNPWVTKDNESCNYDTDGDGVNDSDEIVGCQDETACNYDETATDQGDCTFAEQGRDCDGTLLYSIGAELEGGYLFYIDDETQSGLVTLSYSPGSSDYWEGCTDQLINTSLALGAGQENFLQIRQQCPSSIISTMYRSYGGFDDWFIPSKEELAILYQQKANLPVDPFIVSGDPSPSFISSSTVGSDKVWLMNGWGNWTDIWRSNGGRVLPIRKVLFYDPPGCTDSQACNYNIEAREDDGSCIYPDELGICAFDISCGSNLTGSTANAENNYGEPSPEDIYKFEVTTSGTYEFSTCGSDFDTFLRIYDANMTELYFGDDDGDCGNKTVLNKPLDPGTYYILIEGYQSNSGEYTLIVSCP